MKFVHMSDMHFGNTFSSLQLKNNFIQKRILAQKQAFEKTIDYIKQNNIEHFFICGDLYEQNSFVENNGLPIIEYCNKKFNEISKTKIWISPGNHDPYIKNSYYQTYSWANNVTIFKDKIECYQTPEVDFYGFGFNSFYVRNSHIDEIKLTDKNKINILITHADLDASKNTEKTFNPISSKKLMEIGFDYVALGHIHKSNFSNNSRLIYAGSTIGMGFEGIITGEISKNYYNINFITLDSDFYIEIPIDISNIFDFSELIQEINRIYIDSESVYQIKLIGIRRFLIDTNEIIKYLNFDNILKIKDETTINYNLNEISTRNNLKGYFVKELLEKLENANDNEKIKIQKAIGLNLLE